MSRALRATIVLGIAPAATEDVTPMLNQIHTAADLAADHRRTLQAEADAYRLARTARREPPVAGPARGSRWLRFLSPAARRAARTA